MRDVVRITKKQALRAARAKLPLYSDKTIEKNLEFAQPTLAEAYRIGAEEAQLIIMQRIAAIGIVKRKRASASSTAPPVPTPGDTPAPTR